VGAKVHAAPVNDQQELQGIDQAGFAGVVGCHQGYSTVQRNSAREVTRAVE
jgi:hypothetical protein